MVRGTWRYTPRPAALWSGKWQGRHELRMLAAASKGTPWALLEAQWVGNCGVGWCERHLHLTAVQGNLLAARSVLSPAGVGSLGMSLLSASLPQLQPTANSNFALLRPSACTCSQYQAAVPLDLLPPPLLVTCSKPKNRVYQRQDNELQVSCLWDGYIEMNYSRVQGVNYQKEETDLQPPPDCRWYRDSILVNSTDRWSGQLMLGPGLPGEGPHPPWTYSRIIVQCTSTLCPAPLCFHHNLSIEVSGQDVRLFLLWPHTLPVFEWQPVHLGWCARFKSATWSYHFRSQGGSPADLLIPSNQHSEPPPSTGYPNAELHQVCASYYSYHLTVRYPHRGFYTASISVQNGPRISLSLDFYVEPTLLHVFSVNSKSLSHPHGTLSLSWSLLQLSQGIVAYKLLDMHGTRGWSHSYNYNPFALQSDFCAAPKSQNSREKVVANIYFRTIERMSGELAGKLDFSNETLIFRTSGAASTYLTLNPQKTKMGTYIFSHTLGLYYSTQEGTATTATREGFSSHYIFYQQQSLCYLIIVEFMQLQLLKFSMHVYLNRKETLFKALGEKDIEVHVFNGHSPDKSLVYIVWFIPVQHPLLQCEWTFNLLLFDSRGEDPVQNYTFAYINHIRNAIQFIPDSVLPFNPSLFTGFVAKVKCTGNRLILSILKATVNAYASKVIKSRVACHKKSCSVIETSIQRADASQRMIYYTHGTEFTLAADTHINCSGPKQTDVIWNIYKVPDMTTAPDWSKPFNPPGIGKRNFIILKVPRTSLDAGLYLFNFTMKLVSLDTWESMEASDSVFVKIGLDTLVAFIAGGSIRTVGFFDEWTLNGSAYYNGEAVQPSQGWSFTWYCTKQKTDYASMTLTENAKCHPDQIDLKWITSSVPVQTVQPKTLQGNNVYYFRLVVQNGSRTAQTEQAVQVQYHSTLILNVTCIENCGRSVIPTERFCLSGKCLNCRTSKSLYYWSLHSAESNEISFDWSSKTTTGRSNPYLRINAFAFVSMAEQSYTLSLKVITKKGQSAIYEYSFYVNSPPQIGKCVLNPKIGMAFLTKFIIHCSGFEDKNGPLTYKVIAASDQIKISTISSIESSTLGILVYAGHEYKTPQSFLPIGIPSQNSTLIIYVQVYDALGACSQVTLEATVLDQRKNKSTEVVHIDLHDLISGPTAPMTYLLVTKDYFKIGYFVYMVASVLNNIETSPTNQGSKTDLRQILLNMTTEIPTTDAPKINQVILSICQITHETIEINRESQLLAVRKLKEASEALKRHRDKDLGSKEAEILGNGILTGLSNVLSASLLDHGNVNVNAVKETISVTEILANLVLKGKVPGEHETIMEAKNWTIHLWKDEKWDVSGTFSNRKYCRNCFYPKLKKSHHVELQVDAVVSTVLYEFDRNPFPWLRYTEDIGTMVTGFKMTGTKNNGDIISITPDVVEMIMARKDEAIFDLTIGPDKKLRKTTGGFNFEVTRSSKYIFIQIVSKINITFQVFIYLGLNISHPPVTVYTASHYSAPTPMEMDTNISDCAVNAPYILCLPQSLLWSPFQSSRADRLNISIVLQSRPIVRDQTTRIVRIAVFAAACLYVDGIQNQWKEGTCSLGPQTTYSKIHCICKAKERNTRTANRRSSSASGLGIQFLAGKVLLFPNQVDMKMFLLAPYDQNPVTGLTVLAIFIIYISLAVWLIRTDKGGMRDQIIDLADNDPFHKMRYLVTIYTGSRLRAGTKADVFIELIGQNGGSDVHKLKHPQFPDILHRGSIDTFFLTTKNDLGNIFSLHVWHNNSGFDSNWFLSRVKVQNMDTKQSWLFMCRKWLDLGKDDCQIERSFAVTNPNKPLSKTDYFLITVSNDLLSSHLWLSVFVHAVDSSFNRFRRLSCCLAVLLSSLMFNAIFFSTENVQHIYSAGLQYLRSITMGIGSALISLPVQLILITLFKHSSKKPSTCNTAEAQQEENPPILSENLCKEGKIKDAPLSTMKSQQCPHIDTNFSNNFAAAKETFSDKIQKPQPSWWVAYIPWCFVFFISGVFSFSIISLGWSYTTKTSFEWLIASITSFCLSVFFLETLKIIIFASWNTISAKSCENIPWSRYQDIKYNGRTMPANEMTQLHDHLVKLRASKQYQPIEEEELIILRKRQNVKNLGYIFVKNMIGHFVFLYLILTTTHPTETNSSFYYNQAMHKKFSLGLSKVHAIEDIYRWVKSVFLPLIHNDHQPTYLSETWSKVLGLPRMRQIRAKHSEVKCVYPHGLTNTFVTDSHCQNQYGIDPEDQTDYLGSWSIPVNSSVSNPTSFLGFTYEQSIDQWEYDSHGELNRYPSRGYSFYFFPEEPQINSTERLEALEMKSWLDRRTWVVIIELTTFNPDADLFCSISVLFEFSYIGPLNSSVSVHSYKLPLLADQTTRQFFFFLGIVYMLIIYIVDEYRMLRQERLKYIKTAANLINFGIKTICVLYLVLIISRFKLAFDLMQFYLYNQELFIPFHAASQFDQVLRITKALLGFLLVLKTYRYLRFMFDVRLAQKSLFAALPTIANLSIGGAIFFFAYMSVGYLGFGQHERKYRTLLYSFTTVLSYCALAFRGSEFKSARFLAGFFLPSFMFVMVCVFINLIQAIMISAYMEVKQLVYEEPSNEAEMMYFVVQKIYRAWILATTRIRPTTETSILNTVLYGKHRKCNMQPFKNKKE
ncbi:polycystin family receptor for egg jelly-like [Rhineura floridana]|uniref:polycystin family receptor for egg jelly-like n=1 Tax=Rhineura floridana TaxID=261503 RepID=UPI002AC7F3D4|nr:polycystin family receptor for egg jelly-like [Rhineura floridana]